MSAENQLKLHNILVLLFKKRGIDPSKIEEYLSWNLGRLPSLLTLIDLEKASKRIIEAIKKNESIAIFGDYDVDGTSSCALLYHFFKLINRSVILIQPSRFVEGYGIHPPNIDQAIERGIKLLITVDCGITSNDTAKYAKERGLDLIITDHHKDGNESMPEAYAIVNPNRRDEPKESPLKPLAGVGVAFALALKIKTDLENEGESIPSIYPLLPFVALGTVCDLAPLTPINLTLTRHGLKEMKECRYIGFQTFLSHEERKAPFVPSEKLAFTIGPMINAKGRLDHPEKALLLLTTDDREVAQECYNHLEIANRERKFIQKGVFTEAKEAILKDYSEKLLACVAYSPKWHEGVLGIVASKLVDTFKIPAVVFSNTEDPTIIKASARSAGELDLFSVLNEMNDLYLRFGGHHAACGLSMKLENLAEFKRRLNQKLSEIPAIIRTENLTYDLELNPSEITPELLKQFELLEPFGNNNERPLFMSEKLTIDSYDILKGEHVRWNLSHRSDNKKKFKGISFNFINRFNTPSPEEIFERQKNSPLKIYFKPNINRFNGNEFIQLGIEEIKF